MLEFHISKVGYWLVVGVHRQRITETNWRFARTVGSSIDAKVSDLLQMVIQRRNLSVHITRVEQQTHISFSEVHP